MDWKIYNDGATFSIVLCDDIGPQLRLRSRSSVIWTSRSRKSPQVEQHG